MKAVIYHNPACGTSRNVLALMRHAGVEPEVIEYLTAPPSRDRLVDMIGRAGLTVREAIRQNGTPYVELGLDDPACTDDDLLTAMLARPVLINRPFVETERGVRLARPSEVALEVLPPITQPFRKEDGEVIEVDGDSRPGDDRPATSNTVDG